MKKIFKTIKNFLLTRVRLLVLILIISITAVIILTVFNALFWVKSSQETIFTVNTGSGTREIAKDLKKQKVISSSWLFSSLVYANHWYLQSGVYKIKPGMNLIQVAKLIQSGKVEEYLVTIPEGYRVTQIDNLLFSKGIIEKGEFTTIAKDSEGFLFPDTYRFPLTITPQQIMDRMLKNFKEKTLGLKITNEAITLASIVEREAKNDSERPIIASVYLNRLNIGMKLDADPTIQYGKGSWAPITKNDYKNFQSPYNTYLHSGLPPTPICNPGIKSILAVLNPAKSDYFYFFHKTNGEAVFSQTYQEHLDKLKNL